MGIDREDPDATQAIEEVLDDISETAEDRGKAKA
jgi:hypothetical protein